VATGTVTRIAPSLIGTFGRVEIALPRARLDDPNATAEWKSTGAAAYQRRTSQPMR